MVIRDQDLLDELEKARGGFLFAHVQKELASRQRKRDSETKQAEEKASALAVLPRDTRRRAVIREEMEIDGPSANALRFLPTPLAICGLPYKQLPIATTDYEKRQGRMTLLVSSGKILTPAGEWVQQPLPWGPKARLIMAHLSTLALRNQSPIVELGDSLSEFMHDLGFEVRGGARGTIQPFKDQLHALAACRMTFGAWDGLRSGFNEMKPLEKVRLWDDGANGSPSTSRVQFSETFFQQLKLHALPIDMRALRAFSNSARKLDLLFWLTYRITRLDEKLILDWKPLKEQFGEGFNRDRAFRAQLSDDLDAILEVFPKLRAKLTEQGLILDPTDPSVLSIPKRL